MSIILANPWLPSHPLEITLCLQVPPEQAPAPTVRLGRTQRARVCYNPMLFAYYRRRLPAFVDDFKKAVVLLLLITPLPPVLPSAGGGEVGVRESGFATFLRDLNLGMSEHDICSWISWLNFAVLWCITGVPLLRFTGIGRHLFLCFV